MLRALLFTTLFLALPLAAHAQDNDSDGTPDATDVFPCDASASAAAYFPAQNAHALLLVEDQWPRSGDLDFNDVVLAHNTELRFDTSGNTRFIRLTIEPLALGGTFDNGLAIR